MFSRLPKLYVRDYKSVEQLGNMIGKEVDRAFSKIDGPLAYWVKHSFITNKTDDQFKKRKRVAMSYMGLHMISRSIPLILERIEH